ncbi:MAG TPA: 5'-3' exonuclease H3TH domain-containing protein [Candidatus Saccharimonadales bacterium]|nr:5'-3' exonuclease H3TH domain-containing protein [Candidatus Saccharimonadales bacterium]
MLGVKLLLIDGNSLLHRAYHALPPLTDKDGEMANAVFGFSNMLLKAIDEVKPTHIACAFDTKAPTFRHIEFEKYKAQRKAAPPDLYPQLPKVQKVLDAFGIPYFSKEGFEGDDIVATIASRALEVRGQSLEPSKKTKVVGRGASSSEAQRGGSSKMDLVIILSGDRDVLQLVDGNLKVQMPGWNLNQVSLYGSAEVKEKYGLEPHQMVDYKSLVGDPSDNIPGVAGIGPKTAATLLQKYHTLENLFEHTAEVGETVRTKLEKDKDVALAAKRLVELDRNVDLKFEIENLEFKPDWDKVRAEYERLGFKSIAAKIPGGKEERESQSQSVKSKPINNDDQLKLI